jgi:hypothetical protein
VDVLGHGLALRALAGRIAVQPEDLKRMKNDSIV